MKKHLTKVNIKAVLLTIALMYLIAAASKAQDSTGFKFQTQNQHWTFDTGWIDTVKTIVTITRRKSSILQAVPGYKVTNCRNGRVYGLLTVRRKKFPQYITVWGYQ